MQQDKPRILMFIAFPPDHPKSGGGQVVGWETAQYFRNKGYKVETVVTPYLQLLSSVLWLWKSLQQKDYDIIHCMDVEAAFINLFSRKPSLLEVHAPQIKPFTLKEALKEKRLFALTDVIKFRFFMKLALLNATRVTTPSHFVRQQLVEKFGRKEIEVVPVGISESKIFACPKETASIKNIVFLGRLNPQKGIPYLIRAVSGLIEEGKDIKLDLYGPGDKTQYENPHPANIVFKGYCNEDVIQMLRRYDLCVVPSLQENFPAVTLQAMSAGIPIIATNVGGIPEQLENEKEALIVPPKDDGSLKHAIKRLIESPQLANSLAANGWSRIKKQFTFEKRMEHVENTYNELMHRH